ncbi:hypothetical protein L1987_60003 [Smallanthus sonchifolius]|uniref:Uncharacterized protein n=1 Tax=Smallanthus sonchifolius TaxID=185202 RepID=A0ACB9D7G0_9ASTR|nr:hypothetical protein L1987_60003 [Smallanthus sonchifolius]
MVLVRLFRYYSLSKSTSTYSLNQLLLHVYTNPEVPDTAALTERLTLRYENIPQNEINRTASPEKPWPKLGATLFVANEMVEAAPVLNQDAENIPLPAPVSPIAIHGLIGSQEEGNTQDLTGYHTVVQADIISASPTESHTPNKEIVAVFASTESHDQTTTGCSSKTLTDPRQSNSFCNSSPIFEIPGSSTEKRRLTSDQNNLCSYNEGFCAAAVSPTQVTST